MARARTRRIAADQRNPKQNTCQLIFTRCTFRWQTGSRRPLVGVHTGRFGADRSDWAYSGWRWLGYYELVQAVPSRYQATQDMTRLRHRVLHRIGLPNAP